MHFLETLVLLGGAIGLATASKHVLHEKRDGEHYSWSKREKAPGHLLLPIRIALQEQNLHNADAYLYDVSDPASPNYGKHWSAEQVANTFLPSVETRRTVIQWLTDSGIDRTRLEMAKGHNWIHFNGTVEEAERLFDTEYYYYEHANGGLRLACDSYGLPAYLKEHIHFAMPTIHLEGLKPNLQMKDTVHRRISPEGVGLGSLPCGVLTTIDCLRKLYNFGPSTTSAAGNEIGIGEWADYLVEPDLPIFFKNFTRPKIPASTKPEFLSIDGGRKYNSSTINLFEGVESNLDVQNAYSIVYPQKLRLYQFGDGVNIDSVGTFNIMLDALDASYCTYQGGDAPYVDPQYPDPNLPNDGAYTGPLQCGGVPVSSVFSVSYGQIEGALPQFYQERQCREWMKLGLQGVSVLFASGDSGVANRYNAGYNNSCLNSKYGYVDTNGKRFSPSFPVNCPYITAVGATVLKTNNTADGEKAVESFGSGGGFSNIFPLPSYQASAVKNFMSKYAPKYPAGTYNNSGNVRGFPDVSAIGDNGVVVFNGSTYAIGGTSLSSPIFAGLVTLLNEARIGAGKKPLGFLNPFFYANPQAFNDITEGSNPGCGTAGFKAVPGWDPVTGLGTPNFGKLKEAALKLP